MQFQSAAASRAQLAIPPLQAAPATTPAPESDLGALHDGLPSPAQGSGKLLAAE